MHGVEREARDVGDGGTKEGGGAGDPLDFLSHIAVGPQPCHNVLHRLHTPRRATRETTPSRKLTRVTRERPPAGRAEATRARGIGPQGSSPPPPRAGCRLAQPRAPRGHPRATLVVAGRRGPACTRYHATGGSGGQQRPYLALSREDLLPPLHGACRTNSISEIEFVRQRELDRGIPGNGVGRRRQSCGHQVKFVKSHRGHAAAVCCVLRESAEACTPCC